jgi:hypothetical protein
VNAYAACCCYEVGECEAPFSVEASGRVAFQSSISGVLLSRTEYVCDWSTNVDPSLPGGGTWSLAVESRRTIGHELGAPFGITGAETPITRGFSCVVNGVRIDDRCLDSESYGCVADRPPPEYGLREIIHRTPFHREHPDVPAPDPNQEEQGTTTGVSLILDGTVDGRDVVVDDFTDGVLYELGGSTGYRQFNFRIFGSQAKECGPLPPFGGASPLDQEPLAAGLSIIVPFGPDNPIGSDLFVTFGTFQPGTAQGNALRPYTFFANDGGTQGGKPTIVSPFDAFPAPQVNCGGFPQEFASYHCRPDLPIYTSLTTLETYERSIIVS